MFLATNIAHEEHHSFCSLLSMMSWIYLLTSRISCLITPSAGDVTEPYTSFLSWKVREGGVNIWARQRSQEAEGSRISYSPPSRWFNIQNLASSFLPPCDRRARLGWHFFGSEDTYEWSLYVDSLQGTMAAVYTQCSAWGCVCRGILRMQSYRTRQSSIKSWN